MSKNSEKILAILLEEGPTRLAFLPRKTDLNYEEVLSAVKYLKKKNKAITKRVFPDLRNSIVIPTSE